jgi:hypothetical protein
VERKGKTSFRSGPRDTTAGRSNCPSNSSLTHDNGTSAARLLAAPSGLESRVCSAAKLSQNQVVRDGISP